MLTNLLQSNIPECFPLIYADEPLISQTYPFTTQNPICENLRLQICDHLRETYLATIELLKGIKLYTIEIPIRTLCMKDISLISRQGRTDEGRQN